MGLKENLIAREEGREEKAPQTTSQEKNDLDLDLDLSNLESLEATEAGSEPAEDNIPSENLLLNDDIDISLNDIDEADESTSAEVESDLKMDNQRETGETEGTEGSSAEPVKEDVCPKCGGKRRRNGNYYHLKTCEDYKVNGVYPNREDGEATGKPLSGDTEEPTDTPTESPSESDFSEPLENTQEPENSFLEEPQSSFTGVKEATELHEQLMSLAKQVILEDVKQNYTSKLLTADALNNLIDAYLSGEDNASIANANQVFSSVLDEIISANYKENHYGNLTIPVLEAIKADL